jgi:hypothetical protein
VVSFANFAMAGQRSSGGLFICTGNARPLLEAGLTSDPKE